MILPDKKFPPKTVQNFPVAGIGASAGGLDILKIVLAAIPEDSGIAYVTVIHQSPDFSGSLAEILSKHTPIPVQEIIHNISLAPNHIYIIPENNTLIAQDGVLQLKQRTRNERRNNSIDVFFESLAQVYTTYTIGVILSGTGFDGSFGLKKIKEMGGAAIVQDPETATFKGMPQSAIDADTADFITAPEKIPSLLVAIRNSYLTNYANTEDEHLPDNEEEILQQILKLIFLRTGNDFSQYKQPAMRRQIAKRMAGAQKKTLEDYFNFLRNNKAEQDLLFNDFLIPLTYFFSDAAAFEDLSKTVFPLLVKNASHNRLRIWAAGCASGEEAYSLAISIHEYLLETNNKEMEVQIFASDLSEKSIAKARTAIYSHQDIQFLSEERLRNYFTKNQGQYHISKVIRDMCVFAVHNFIKDPPFAKIDLAVCRNVLSYFNPVLQNRVLESFHYALKEKGLLLLGRSESASSAQDLFERADEQEKIYVRKMIPGGFDIESRLPLKGDNINEELQSNNELIYLNDELKDRQEQLILMRNYSDSIINTIREPLLIIDKNFIIRTANPAFYKYFQTTESEMEGNSFFEVGGCQWDIPKFKEQFLKMLDTKENIKNFKITAVCKGIGKKTMMINACPMLSAKPHGMILIALDDITDLANTNELLTAKNAELQKYNDQLESFTSAASHDLQEPLRKIQMFSKRIGETEKNISETGRHDLERIQFLINNMTQLITDLINYSKANFVNRQYKKTDMNALLKKTISDIKDTIIEKKAVIAADSIPPLKVIPHQIQQLFTNLISNSIKYTKDNVIPKIEIKTEPVSGEEITALGGSTDMDYVKIKITDNGIGFDKEYENRVFDPFYRLHNRSEYSGNGLGLTLVKKITANHNGFIKADSKINQGTTMSIYIPV